jgi:hypothetical protein
MLWSHGSTVGIPAHTTHNHGKWNAGWQRTEYIGSPSFERVSITPGPSPSLSFAKSALETGVPIDGWVHGGAAEGSIDVPDSCGWGRFVLHDLELGPEMGGSAQVRRVTAAWELVCTFGQDAVRELRGCVHYDADNPVLAWP